MSLSQQYEAIVANTTIVQDEEGLLGAISVDDWEKLAELKDSIEFDVDSSTYKGTTFPTKEKHDWDEWHVVTNDDFATARVIYQKDGGGFFVSIHFKDEPYWQNFDIHEAKEEQSFAVLRMLPFEAIQQIKTAMLKDGALTKDEYCDRCEWMDRAFEEPIAGMTR